MTNSPQSAQWTNHEDGSFSFMIGDLGWSHARFDLRVDGQRLESTVHYQVDGDQLASDKTREAIVVVERDERSVVLRRDITNATDKPIAVSDIMDFFSPEPLGLGGPVSASTIYHAECPFEWGIHRVPFERMANRPEKTLLGDPVSPHFGATGWTPYTGIVFANSDSGAGLIDGALSQNRFYRYWTPHPDGRVEATMGMCGLDAKTIAPGETLEGELIYLEIAPSLDVGRPFDGYNEVLRWRLRFHAADIEHGRDFVWGSWNDGPYNMVHDFIVRRNAEFCKDHLPSVNWIQIDEGYQVQSDRQVFFDPNNMDTGAGRPRIAHYHYLEPENHGVCERKFPEGMRACSDHIRSLGLRPAIWTGLNVSPVARVVNDHPEWFMDNIPCPSAVKILNPDPSIPECMEAIKEGFRVIVRDYGFEGIKLDFWTYSFVSNQRPFTKPMRFSRGNKTGLEYTHELLAFVRELLGDGYLQTGCDISAGNPFLGQYVDNFRFGEDIADGEWRRVIFGVNIAAFLQCSTRPLGFIANSDSIGVLPGLTPDERRTWMNFCFVSATMVEIGGDFADTVPEIDKEYLEQGRPSLIGKTFGCPPETLEDLRRISADVDNTAPVVFPDQGYLDGATPPAVWLKCDPNGRPRHAGVFNWTEEPMTLTVEPSEWSAGEWVDFWDDEAVPLEAGTELELAPHASRLFTRR